MSFQLSIRIPAIAVPQPVRVGHFFRAPVPIDYYKWWTPSDYEFAYKNANETVFTWADAVAPRRSARLASKQKKQYKM